MPIQAENYLIFFTGYSSASRPMQTANDTCMLCGPSKIASQTVPHAYLAFPSEIGKAYLGSFGPSQQKPESWNMIVRQPKS